MEKEWNFAELDDGSIEIIDYKGIDTRVFVPYAIGLSRVTSIGNKAFFENQSICFVKIPDGVTSIGAFAFGKCPNLDRVSIPSTVTEIHPDAFIGNESFMISSDKETYAEEYAKENGIRFIPIRFDECL